MGKLLDKFDVEGNRRFNNAYKDLAYVKTKGERAIACLENVLTGMITYLEVKLEKLELKVTKLEMAKYPSSSSRRSKSHPGSSTRCGENSN